jgi:GNAT superfamily N-acetyltransferase
MSGVMALLQELAAFENASGGVETTVEQLQRDAFGERPLFHFFVTESQSDGALVGLAVYFVCYSTWKGKCFHLEDFIVSKAHRGQELGKRLFNAVVMQAKHEAADRLSWMVQDWNDGAVRFYQSMGAQMPPHYQLCRLERAQLSSWQDLAPSAS